MRESKIIKRFQRLLAECEEEHTFSGTILEFDTVDYVPKDRLAKGMIITSREGTRSVNFVVRHNNRPVMEASSMQVNDLVQVFWKA